MLDDVSYIPKWKGDANKYIKQKLEILSDRYGFCIKPTEEEVAHLYTLKTQIAIDNAILSIINKRWD